MRSGLAWCPFAIECRPWPPGEKGGGGQSAEVIALVNGEQFDISNIDNLYTQNYVNLYEQDALSTYTFEQTDRIHYYPHLSFGGNITRAYDRFQYYAGTIAGDSLQVYGGLDYQGHTDDGWYYQAGGIGFLNPNYDRYSNLSGSVAKQFRLSNANSMVLGASFELGHRSGYPSGRHLSRPARAVILPCRPGLTWGKCL